MKQRHVSQHSFKAHSFYSILLPNTVTYYDYRHPKRKATETMNDFGVFLAKPSNNHIDNVAVKKTNNPSNQKTLGDTNVVQTKYQMVALDLDGTLLGPDHQLAEVQAQYLRSLQARGFTVCIATGRAAPSVYEHVKKLNLPEPVPVVCSNGARGFTVDAKTLEKKELFSNPVSKEIVEETLQIARQHNYAVQYYHDDDIYVNSSKPEHAKITQLYSQLTGSQITQVSDDFESLLNQDKLPSKLLVLFDESKIDQATQLYTTKFSSTATVVMGAFDWFLEVLHPSVTKGHGLLQMCQQLEIPLEECIAMGDGANDLEFLDMAGLGLAMKNAKDAAKKHADVTLEWTNADHGVMKALQQLEQEDKLQF
jgi:Cof subfamily protein (haloacid dehalogenase superfamily)